jgi:hypothetical protein
LVFVVFSTLFLIKQYIHFIFFNYLQHRFKSSSYFFNDYLEWRDISNLIFDHFHLTFVSFILFAIYIFVSIDYFTHLLTMFCLSLLPFAFRGFHVAFLLYVYMYICPTRFQCYNLFVSSSNNRMSATSGAGSVYSSRTHAFTLFLLKFLLLNF